MHRVLALKFAAWLNPAFELWVYATIDDILFGSYKEDENDLREIARLKTEIHRKTQALEQSPLQFELWVYATIDDILFGSYKEDENDLREIARLKTEIHRKTQALEQSPLQLELEQLNRDLKKREKKMKIRKQQRISDYLPLFKETEFREE